MNTLLFLYSADTTDFWPQPWLDGLAACGSVVQAEPLLEGLRQRIDSRLPGQVLVDMPAPELIAALDEWPDGPPCAISLIPPCCNACRPRAWRAGGRGWWRRRISRSAWNSGA